MSKVLVIGHKNPDTDSIMSAISYAYLLNQTGVTAEAVAQGTPNEETQYALDYFGQEAPRVVDGVSSETDTIALVDHNEAQQSVDDRAKVRIMSVIDHHRIANFEVAEPLYYRCETVGCTNTILYKMYQEKGVAIPKRIAGLMVSAIISDTLLKKSPTCTQEDIVAMEALAKLAEVDLEVYGLALLKAGTNLDNQSPASILEMDAKSFPMGDKKVRVGQVNIVDEQDVLQYKAELMALMEEKSKEENFELFLLLITNILTSNSTGLVVGNTLPVEEAFKGKVEDNLINLEGVVSRKKQVIPQLTRAIEG